LAIDLKGKKATKTEKNKNPKAIKAKRVLLIGKKGAGAWGLAPMSGQLQWLIAILQFGQVCALPL